MSPSPIPIRRLPCGGPPSTVQFQGCAEILRLRRSATSSGWSRTWKLEDITSHGKLDHPDNCFVRVAVRRITTYGVGDAAVQANP